MSDTPTPITFRAVLSEYVRSDAAKEIYAAHLIVITAALITYAFTNKPTAAGVFIIGMMCEMLGLHTLWFYRENQDKQHPLRYAVTQELKGVMIAVTGLILIAGIAYALFVTISIPVFYTVFTVAAVMFAFLTLKALIALNNTTTSTTTDT